MLKSTQLITHTTATMTIANYTNNHTVIITITTNNNNNNTYTAFHVVLSSNQ